LRTVLIEWRSCVAEPATPGNEIWQHQRLLILGGPGSGKTTLLRHIAFTCAHTRLGLAHRSRRDRVRDQYGWPTKPFPIYIPLRALRYAAGTNARPLIASYAHLLVEQGLLGTNMGVCDPQFFGVRLKQGGCIVLIDAFDELRSPTERGLIAKLIAELPLGPKRNLNRIVVTSRPKGYERQLDSAAFVHRQVAELTLEQAATFINQRYAGLAQLERRAGGIKPDEQLRWDVAKRAKQLVALLPVNPGLSRLSRNPLLLSLTVAIHYRQGGRELPRERHELYEKAVDLLTEEWERLRADEIGIEPTSTDGDLSLKEKKRLLAELAWSMFDRADSMSEGSHAVVLGADARASLARTLDSFAGFAPGLSGRERAMRCESEAERWLHDLSERGGILQELGNIPGSNEVEITFAHLSFQEYMASQAVGESSDQARYERLLSRWNTPAWREVLLLYAASRSDASPVVEWLLAQGSAEGELLAGATVVERPQRLRPELLNQTVRAMQAIVTGAAGLDEQAATEALAVLVDSRAAEREWLLQIIQHAPFPAVRLRALELVAGSATNGPLDEPAAEDLKAVALAVLERERNYRPRLIAGYLLARDDPRFQGDGWIPELVPIPAGAFVMGEDQEVRDGSPQRQRRLAHTVTIPYDYQIGRYPVTNAQWRRFVEAGGYTTKRYWTKAGWRWRQDLGDTWFERLRKLIPRWREPIISPETYWWDDRLWNSDNQPVVGVSWFEAVAYCRWLTETVADGRVFYLPSEAEWERAARGSDGRIYPWGNEWAADHCNSQEFGLPRTTPVGSFAEGVSVEGAYDMAGNVWEWCATTYGTSYPYTVVDEWTEAYLEEDTARRIRGGSAWNEQRAVRGAYRGFSDPRYRGYGRGLRVARRAPGTALTP
jgi:formylglycine-generating enzyme required for sulfatase activity/energy-coupling factor transporter ATP-binding protein EcfA2